MEIPDTAYWDVHTARANENFPITRLPISVYPDFVRAFAFVKRAAARANAKIGALDDRRAGLIDAACEEIKAGKLHDQFTVGVVQGGAGTSTNMNANEVITNRAFEIGGQTAAHDHDDERRIPAYSIGTGNTGVSARAQWGPCKEAA